jgi:hypothetical protein
MSTVLDMLDSVRRFFFFFDPKNLSLLMRNLQGGTVADNQKQQIYRHVYWDQTPVAIFSKSEDHRDR